MPNTGAMDSCAVARMLAVTLLLLYHQNFYASAQDVTRKEVTCEQDSIVLDLRFDGRFGGIVYAKNAFDRSRCRQNGDNARSMTFTLGFNTCGVNRDDETYDVVVVVQKNPDVILSGDEAYHITCKLGAQAGDKVSLDVKFSPGDLATEPIVRTSFPSVVTMAVRADPSDTTSVTDVDVGDTIYLVINLIDSGTYSSFKMISCEATGDSSSQSLELVDDTGCVSTEADPNIVVSAEVRRRQNPNYLKYIEMKAFKFPDVDDVTFTCQVNLCDRSQTCALQCEARDDIAEDAPIVANGNGNGNGNGDNRRRFKRDVLQVGRRLPTSSSSATTALPEPIQQMVGSVRVHAPGIETVGTTTVAPPDDVSRPRRRHCFTVSWIAACAAAFFAVLMIAITACMCLCARWRRLEKLQDHQKSSLESLSSPLATIHGLMNVCHIPRPSLINHPAPSIDKEGETNEVAPQTLTDRL